NVALRTAVLINGGAAIAVLGFIGAVAAKEKITVAQISTIAGSLMWFAVGVACAVLSMTFAYFTNYSMVAVENSKEKIWEHPYVKAGPRTNRLIWVNRALHSVAVLSALASLALFIFGMLEVRASMLHLGS